MYYILMIVFSLFSLFFFFFCYFTFLGRINLKTPLGSYNEKQPKIEINQKNNVDASIYKKKMSLGTHTLYYYTTKKKKKGEKRNC
jgi:Na+/melibiose symporter-like transporter